MLNAGNIARVANRKAALADPERRAVIGAANGWLTPDQRNAVLAEIKKGDRSYSEIGYDWLITGCRVGEIAREEGIIRHPYKLRARR